MKKIYALAVLGMLVGTEAMAQDPQFTQFYAAPLYQNPAFAGAAHRGRAIANYRNQWPAIPRAFVTYAASVDNYWRRYNSGGGVIVSMDRTGSGQLASIKLGGQYAYELTLNKQWCLRAGFEFGYAQRSIDVGKLLFRDQISPTGNLPTTNDPIKNTPQAANMFDVGSGALLYSKRFYVGLSSMHMNQPNQSITGEVDRIAVRWTGQAGMNIPIGTHKTGGRYNSNETVTTLSPAILYKRQGNFNQLDAGAYINVEPIVIGAWYRGIPLLKNADKSPSHDAVAMLIGVKLPFWSVGYSYDLTVSGLGPGSAGSHELSLSYEFDTGNNKRRHSSIPCPKF